MTIMSTLMDGELGVSKLGLAVILSCAYVFITAVYRWKFHQLSIYPGPALWSMTRLPNAYHHINGSLQVRVAKIHARYGPVVRIGPHELSYINAEAWSDIYGPAHKGNHQLAKDQKRIIKPHSGVHNIVNTFYDHDHARMRRNLAQAFTNQSLREQEPLLTTYFDLLIAKLSEKMVDGPVDLERFYNFTTFDIIGDLTVGEPFGCLEKGVLHQWVSLVFGVSKSVTLIAAMMKLSDLVPLILSLIPGSREKEIMFKGFTNAKLDKRLALEEPRSDFMTVAQKTVGTPQGMTLTELRETVGVMIIAGSETTATLLSGVTYYLLTNPSVHQKLITEIRSHFKNDQEITNASTLGLPYLHAVLQEGLRIFPPVPSTFARQTPASGSMIAGKFVAGNTVVGVQHWSAYHSPANFFLPDQFIPERWMGDERFVNDKRAVCQPFHIGPRNCIGKTLAWTEMNVILAKMVWNFDMVLEEESRRDWAKGFPVFTFWEKPPLLVKLTPAV